LGGISGLLGEKGEAVGNDNEEIEKGGRDPGVK